jgi:hypothetical protein
MHLQICGTVIPMSCFLFLADRPSSQYCGTRQDRFPLRPKVQIDGNAYAGIPGIRASKDLRFVINTASRAYM